MESIEDIVRRIVRDELSKQPPASSTREVVTVDPRRLYSIASAAKLLEVSPSYLYQRIQAGDITIVELGHGKAKQRISAPALDEFIRAREFVSRSSAQP